MKHPLPIACAIAVLTAPIPALAEQSEGRELAQTLYSSIDTAERGFLDQGQFLNFGRDVFTSMDSNDDRNLTLSEFMSWDYGMRNIAEDAGREEAFDTAMRVVFSFWDRDGDGTIAAVEQNRSLKADFRRADLDEDALMSKDEFLGGFSVMVALRAAINPAPLD